MNEGQIVVAWMECGMVQRVTSRGIRDLWDWSPWIENEHS